MVNALVAAGVDVVANNAVGGATGLDSSLMTMFTMIVW